MVVRRKRFMQIRSLLACVHTHATRVNPSHVYRSNKPYNAKSDVWALGVVLFELCQLRVPWDAANFPNLRVKIVHNNPPPLTGPYSEGLQQLVKDMLVGGVGHVAGRAQCVVFEHTSCIREAYLGFGGARARTVRVVQIKDPRRRPDVRSILKRRICQHHLRLLMQRHSKKPAPAASHKGTASAAFAKKQRSQSKLEAKLAAKRKQLADAQAAADTTPRRVDVAGAKLSHKQRQDFIGAAVASAEGTAPVVAWWWRCVMLCRVGLRGALCLVVAVVLRSSSCMCCGHAADSKEAARAAELKEEVDDVKDALVETSADVHAIVVQNEQQQDDEDVSRNAGTILGWCPHGRGGCSTLDLALTSCWVSPTAQAQDPYHPSNSKEDDSDDGDEAEGKHAVRVFVVVLGGGGGGRGRGCTIALCSVWTPF